MASSKSQLPTLRGTPSAAGLRRHVLIVDDEPLILACFARMLGSRYELTLAQDGIKALALLRTRPDFDAVICDLAMPGLDAPAVFAQLDHLADHWRERTVFVTGGASTPRMQAFVNTLKHAPLDKPMTAQELRQAVEIVLEARTDEKAPDDQAHNHTSPSPVGHRPQI
ncbi:MAG: response regulator [Nannocystaceae bacterium]